MKLNDYMNDGANYQAQAVMCYLRHFNIEESYNTEYRDYAAEIKIERWENCREQGYVLSLVCPSPKTKQLNIAFFEHRNGDSVCAVKWEQLTLNSPTIATAEFGNVYKDKYDTSYEVGYGEADKMATWIKEELTTFWTKNNLNKAK